MDTKINSLSDAARAVAERISSLRDFLKFLSEHGQCITWPDQVIPEPDIRNVVVAAGRDAMNAPAIIFDKITGYPGKRIVVGVHGSFTNLALLLGYPKCTTHPSCTSSRLNDAKRHCRQRHRTSNQTADDRGQPF